MNKNEKQKKEEKKKRKITVFVNRKYHIYVYIEWWTKTERYSS